QTHQRTRTATHFPYTTLFRSKGNCWDNAVAESFFKSLKTELIYGNKLISKEQMKLEIFEYIEIWYNRKRRHSALNYATIEEFNKDRKSTRLNSSHVKISYAVF